MRSECVNDEVGFLVMRLITNEMRDIGDSLFGIFIDWNFVSWNAMKFLMKLKLHSGSDFTVLKGNL